MAKIAFTAGRVAGFKCPADKAQAFLWDVTAPGLGLRATPAGKPAYVFQGEFQQKTIRITIGNPDAWSIPQAQEKARQAAEKMRNAASAVGSATPAHAATPVDPSAVDSAASQPTPTLLRCSACFEVVNPDDMFCGHCGHKQH